MLSHSLIALRNCSRCGDDPNDVYFLQYGVNFLDQNTSLLLIGGAIYGRVRDNKPWQFEDLRLIANGALFNPEEYTNMRPSGKLFLDAHYIVSTVGGLYGRLDPERAVRMLKKHLMPLKVEAPAWQRFPTNSKSFSRNLT